jgi:hypothetical protein
VAATALIQSTCLSCVHHDTDAGAHGPAPSSQERAEVPTATAGSPMTASLRRGGRRVDREVAAVTAADEGPPGAPARRAR